MTPEEAAQAAADREARYAALEAEAAANRAETRALLGHNPHLRMVTLPSAEVGWQAGCTCGWFSTRKVKSRETADSQFSRHIGDLVLAEIRAERARNREGGQA